MSGAVIAAICSMSPNEGVSESGPRALGHCLDNALIGSHSTFPSGPQCSGTESYTWESEMTFEHWTCIWISWTSTMVLLVFLNVFFNVFNGPGSNFSQFPNSRWSTRGTFVCTTTWSLLVTWLWKFCIFCEGAGWFRATHPGHRCMEEDYREDLREGFNIKFVMLHFSTFSYPVHSFSNQCL